MGVTAWLRPTATFSSTGVVTPDNVWTSNDSRGVWDTINDEAIYGTFGDFAIPAGMGITGIEVEVEGILVGVGVNHLVGIDLRIGGAFPSSSLGFDPTSTGADELQTLGGSTNLWGGSPVASDFVDGTFRVRLTCDSLSATSVNIDSFRVRVYYAPIITITGTLGTIPTEKEIMEGGKTIILTVAGDTWQTAGANFDAIRDDIINGFDSGAAEAGGWDAVVKVGQSLGGVVRTSNTIVTMTLDAFPGYLITANETITAIIPLAAVVGADAPSTTPTPAFVVSNQRFRLPKPNTLKPNLFTPSSINR